MTRVMIDPMRRIPASKEFAIRSSVTLEMYNCNLSFFKKNNMHTSRFKQKGVNSRAQGSLAEDSIANVLYFHTVETFRVFFYVLCKECNSFFKYVHILC